MGFVNSRLYRALDVFGSLFLLNLLWLALCVPLVTAFPATAAMFAVVRDWARDGGDYSLGRFFHHLRANFAQSLGIGILWVVLGGILAADFIALEATGTSLRLPLRALLGLVTVPYIFASIYLFPVMVNYEFDWRAVIRNSFFIAFAQLGTTLLCLVIIVLITILFLILPVTVLMAGSVTAYLLYIMCQRAFQRIEALKNKS
jgi:uncharacterized membrane protein YesL